MIENKSLHRKKDYIFLDLNVASVAKGLSEVKDLHETFVELVKDILFSHLRTKPFQASRLERSWMKLIT